jgi:hypothetical protein
MRFAGLSAALHDPGERPARTDRRPIELTGLPWMWHGEAPADVREHPGLLGPAMRAIEELDARQRRRASS